MATLRITGTLKGSDVTVVVTTTEPLADPVLMKNKVAAALELQVTAWKADQ